MDGKAMNGFKGSYLNVVSAFSSRNGLVLGGVCTEGSKRNEQAAMIKLVKLLSLKNAIVTADAMGTQTTVVDAICEAGADYVLPVKDNQPDTAEAVRLCFDSPFTAIERYETTDKQGGRFEERVYELVVLGDHKLPFTEKWQDLAAVGKRTSTVTCKGETTVDVHHYIMSVTNMKDFASAARGHWGVESMHWVLDVVFREDDCVLHDKNAQQNMGVLRKIVLNAFKLDNPKSNIASRRRRSGWNEQELLKTIKLLANI
jgi:predicted transposase YbfD/YdcC